MTIKSLYSDNFYNELEKNGPKVDIRQTVLSGPKNSSGRADFLQAGTGLEVITKDLSIDALVVTFGDGFGRNGQRDRTISNSAVLSWSGLPASETEVFLYVDLLEDGTLQTGHTVLEPVYSLVRPSTPATSQAFYPTSHAHKMEFFDGASWVKVLRTFVGQVSTNSTSVTSITEYDYGTGRGYEAPLGSGQKWQQLIGSRSESTTYTNDTGRSIAVAVIGSTDGGTNGNALQLLVDGTKLVSDNHDSGSNTRDKSVYGVIPNGSEYRVVAPIVALYSWRELR